jgi:transposase
MVSKVVCTSLAGAIKYFENLLEPHLPGRDGSWGGVAQDNRKFVDAVFWIFRTGAPWRDLPPDYGGWSNTHRRFIRWRTRPSGKNCWNNSWMSPTLSGS